MLVTSGPYQERRALRPLPPAGSARPRAASADAAARAARRDPRRVALVVFGVLFFRLWSLQVLSGDEYLNAAQSNQLRLVRVEAPRGPILDRRGRVVVSNVAGTAVELWVGDMPKEGATSSCSGSPPCSTSSRASSRARSTSAATTR